MALFEVKYASTDILSVRVEADDLAGAIRASNQILLDWDGIVDGEQFRLDTGDYDFDDAEKVVMAR